MKTKKLKNKIKKVLHSGSFKKNKIFSTEYDLQVSDKFFEFINNVIKLDDGLTIDVSHDSLSLVIDFLNIKKNGGAERDEIFSFEIDSEGFSLKLDSSVYYFNDSKMLKRLKPILSKKFEEISKGKLFKSIEDIFSYTNLIRTYNLEKFLNT